LAQNPPLNASTNLYRHRVTNVIC